MVVRGEGVRGTRNKGHVAPLFPLLCLYLPALVCTLVLIHTPLQLFIPSMFVHTPHAHPPHSFVPPCFPCTLLLLLPLPLLCLLPPSVLPLLVLVLLPLPLLLCVHPCWLPGSCVPTLCLLCPFAIACSLAPTHAQSPPVLGCSHPHLFGLVHTCLWLFTCDFGCPHSLVLVFITIIMGMLTVYKELLGFKTSRRSA